jgi:hypothetical protein
MLRKVTKVVTVIYFVNAHALLAETFPLAEIALRAIYPNIQDVSLGEMENTTNAVLASFRSNTGKEANVWINEVDLPVPREDSEHLFILTVPQNHETSEDLTALFDEKLAPPDSAASAVILVRENKSVTKSTIAAGSFTSELDNARVGELIREGESSLLVNIRSAHVFSNPRQVVLVREALLFRLPSLDLLFSTVVDKQVMHNFGQAEQEISNRVISFQPPQHGTVNDIIVRDSTTTHEQRFAYDEQIEKYVYETPPLRTAENMAAKIKLTETLSKTSMLRLRVLSESGEPIGGAFVDGSLHIRESPFGEAKSGYFSGSTDADGRFEHETRGAVTIRLVAPDHFEKTVKFTSADLGEDEIEVTLEPAPVAVAMSVFKITENWSQETDSVHLFGSFEPIQGIYDSTVDDPNSADIEFEVKKTGATIYEGERYDDIVAHNLQQWRVTVSPLKGWQIADGPVSRHDSNDPRLSTAPLNGYQSQISFTAGDGPKTFFLRSLNGKRFGKLWHVDFRDFSRYGVFQYEFRAFGLIQRDDTGITSLRQRSPGITDSPGIGQPAASESGVTTSTNRVKTEAVMNDIAVTNSGYTDEAAQAVDEQNSQALDTSVVLQSPTATAVSDPSQDRLPSANFYRNVTVVLGAVVFGSLGVLLVLVFRRRHRS